jgi:hypothetical protein
VVELAVSLLAIAVLFAFADWRWGLLLCVVTAILQDPIRKITPDQPVFFIVFVGIVFAAACLGAVARGVPLTPGSVVGRYRLLAMPMTTLLLLIILQAVNSFVRFGNPMLTLIGLLTYLLPLPSFIFAYQLALRGGEARIRQFIRGYLSLTLLALTTVYLQYTGYDWSILGQVGSHFLIFDEQTGAIVQPNSGIFRAAEIAAWHAATAACFVLLLATWRKINIQTLLTAIIGVALLVGIATLTGRRKAVVEVAVFASTYFILWLVFQKSRAKLGILLVIAGLIGFGWLVGQLGDDSSDQVAVRSSNYGVYVERSKAVFADAPKRFVELGIAPIMWAYDSFGVIGAGLGTGTQGAQYFGREEATAAAAEGGLGKITIELGIPGLFVVGWLAILVFKQLWRIMRASSRISPRVARLSYGLFSFLVANVAAFSVATQAYGDLFILLILSWTLGFLFAVPAMIEHEVRARRPALFKEFAPVIRLKPS